MAIYQFQNFIPVVHPSSFVHPLAAVTGNVIIGKDCYIGPGAAIRGDWGGVIIKDGCNVQENCTIHMFPGVEVVLEESAHIGHGAIIHGAHIGRNVLVGMNAVIMDNVIVGEESIIGAQSLVKEHTIIDKRSLWVGNPAKFIKAVSNEMMEWKVKGTALYQALPKQMHKDFKEVEPLREIEKNRPSQESLLKTWNEIKNDNA